MATSSSRSTGYDNALPWRLRNSFKKKCMHGDQCSFYRRGTCRYYHSDQHKHSRSRSQLIVANLTHSVDIDLSSLVNVDALQSVAISNVRTLGSYSKHSDNHIAVPGCPQQFVPPTEAITIPSPNGTPPIVYPNFAHRLEPLVRSVQCMTPEFNILDACDIVANAGSMSRIMEFLDGELYRELRYDMEWRPTDNTLLIQVWRGSPRHEFYGGRRGDFARRTCCFPDSTPESLKSSLSYHRVLSYSIGGLCLALHCETDSFYDPTHPPSTGAAPSQPPLQQTPLTPPMSPIQQKVTGHQRRGGWRPIPAAVAFGSRYSMLGTGGKAPDDSHEGKGQDVVAEQKLLDTLVVDFPCGRNVPADQLLEIKIYNELNQNESLSHPTTMSRLYFTGLKNLYQASHKGAIFKPGQLVMNLEADLQQWERDQQPKLVRLVALLRRLIELSREHSSRGDNKLSLLCSKTVEGKQHAAMYVRNDDVSFLPAEF